MVVTPDDDPIPGEGEGKARREGGLVGPRGGPGHDLVPGVYVTWQITSTLLLVKGY